MAQNNQINNPIPHHSLFKKETVGLLIALFLGLKALTSLFLPNENPGFASDLTAENILRAVNEQRALRNLLTLNTNSKLSSAAQSKSDDMQARHYFAHADPDGKYIWDKIVAAGYTPYLQLGENLAIEFYDTENLMSAWMNSPTHRANILQEGFKDQGMGLAFGNTGQGQYHSAIANTFGAQAQSPAAKPIPPPAPAPAPAPKPAAKPTPKPAPAPIPTPSPAVLPATPAAAPQPAKDPIKIREEHELALNAEADFILPHKEIETPTTTQPNEEAFAPAIVGSQEEEAFDGRQSTRYAILIFGVILLLFLISDLQQVVENKLGSMDKKINNLAVLVISLIVIALIYFL